ncbi:hypothetical protein Gorai_003018 [Gossypium raimondii]|uniref:DUF4283 domain-containing protein n=1 Tax=Gossypium raimondii TaxID=29730 RepID=A0A7J8QP00_GOSRA|nr:hypothetical protein [Gossypium raimondii]
MYRVFKSLWYTKEVDFVALKKGVVIVKFGCLEDHSRILNLMHWFFDICLFSMMPFEKGNDIDSFEFWLSPFWLRIYNIPIGLMDSQTALDVGNTIGKLVAIDWKDRYGGWIEFMRFKVKINVLKPMRRVVKLVDKDRVKMIGVIKYERLPDFFYMRALIVTPNQDRGMRRNEVELVKSKAQTNIDKEESQTNSRDESGQLGHKRKEMVCKEDSMSTSPME